MSEETDRLNDDNLINLTGSAKWVTPEGEDAYRVLEGSVCLYIIHALNGKVDRRVKVTECQKDSVIPTFNFTENVSHNSYIFCFSVKETGGSAVLERFEPGEDLGKYRNDFIAALKSENEDKTFDKTAEFNLYFVRFFGDALEREKKVIGGMEKDRIEARNLKQNLIFSVFNSKKKISYIGKTDSELYNLMSVFCDYMNVSICPYRALYDVFDNDFTVSDIARFSHFVTRKITPEGKWYKKRGAAFLGFYKDTGRPVLCIQEKGHYLAYDTEKGYEKLIDEELARNISDEAYIIYHHLPGKSLKLMDVVKFGTRRIKGCDITNFIIMYILVTLIGLLLPVLNEQLFDKLIPISEMKPIIQVGEVILACMVGNIFFSVVQNIASFRAVKTMEYDIVSATYGRIFRLPQKFIDRFGTTELVNRASSVSQVFTTTVSSGITAVMGFVLSLFYLVKMFNKSKVLAFRGLIMSAILAVVMYLFGRLRISRERERLEYTATANGRLYHFLTGIMKIKVSGSENRSLYEFEKANVESVKCDVRSRKISNIGGVVTSVMNMLYTGFIYYTVIKKKQDLTVGEYTAFNSAYGMFTSAVNQLVNFFLTNATLVPTMDRIRPIFEQECEITDKAAPLGRLKGALEARHLDFAYGEEEDTLVLNDVSFDIKPGEFIGIVGSSGCGKSTLLKCLLGFEEPKRGNIFYDGKDLKSIDKSELRRQIGVVLQDGQLIAGNIYLNVTMAVPEMEPSEAMELLKVVDLYNDVEAMPMGIFTSISEGGSVSGGQKQRILLARAIANNPRILLLDEATSALDNVTQQMVCRNLGEKNITRIMIAHRLSTVKDCDRILVMDRGSIVEIGNYTELMNKKGLFYELARRQQLD